MKSKRKSSGKSSAMAYNGVLNVYKERGYTSSDVVVVLRKILGMKKIGHGGTLDPDATGVLPILLGPSTRISEYVLEADKTYIGEAVFGTRTTTMDASGDVTATSRHIPSEEEILAALDAFSGKTVEQKPPMYSAVKVKGKKLYQYARKGREVERKTRKVTFYKAEALRFYDNRMIFRVRCSKGTYIRSFVDDLGVKANSFAYLSRLIRTETAGMGIEDSIPLDLLREMEDPSVAVESPDKYLSFPVYRTDKEGGTVLRNGGFLPFDGKEGLYRLYEDDLFIGIGETRVDDRKMMKVKKRLV